MAVGDVYRLTAIWDNSQDRPKIVNVFHFVEGSGILIQDTPEEDLIGAWQEEVELRYASFVTSNLTLRIYRVSKAPVFATILEVADVNLAGQLSGDPMPPQLAGISSYKTADLSRRGRGRSYLPPASEAMNTGGHPATAYLDNGADWKASLMEGMNSVTLNHKEWEFAVWSTSDQVAKPVTNVLLRSSWGVQRDRKQAY